jgi:hypothetical protein
MFCTKISSIPKSRIDVNGALQLTETRTFPLRTVPTREMVISEAYGAAPSCPGDDGRRPGVVRQERRIGTPTAPEKISFEATRNTNGITLDSWKDFHGTWNETLSRLDSSIITCGHRLRLFGVPNETCMHDRSRTRPLRASLSLCSIHPGMRADPSGIQRPNHSSGSQGKPSALR